MTYVTGLQATTTQPTVDLMTILDGYLLAAGFTLFDAAYTSGTDITNVYKSALATNGVVDWYLIIRRLAITGSLYFSVCESYVAGTHLASTYPPASTVAATVGTPTAGFANSQAAALPTSALINYQPSALVTTSPFNWVLSVNPLRVIFGTRRNAMFNSAVYAGLYDDLLPLAISPVPLIVSRLLIQSSFTSNGATTREPNQLSSVTNNFHVWTTNTPITYSAGISISPYVDPYVPAERMAILSGRGTLATGLRGYFKDMYMWEAASGFNGDKVNILRTDATTATYRTLGYGTQFMVRESA